MKKKIIKLLRSGIKEDAIIALILAYKMPLEDMQKIFKANTEINGLGYKEVLYIERQGKTYVLGSMHIHIYDNLKTPIPGWINVTPEI